MHSGHKSEAALLPFLSAFTKNLLTEKGDLLDAWAEEHGSPLHVVLPSELSGNVKALRVVFDEFNVNHAIYYGAKVNKSCSLMTAALEAGAGIDVSSLFELRDAERLGAAGWQIVATGPAKTKEFHENLVRLNALISIDSPEELNDLTQLLFDGEKPQPVLFRLRPRGHDRSRFGMNASEIGAAMKKIAGDARIRLLGFHFHLSGYRWEDRLEAFRQAIDLMVEARGNGLDPKIIDIGGGLPVQYVEQSDWLRHLESQTEDDYRTGRIPASLYPYGGTLSAPEWLRNLLAAAATPTLTVAEYLRHEGLTLAMEPGRALADQSAFSLFRVTRVKDLNGRNGVIFVEGSSFSACETWFASEFLIDPILIPQSGAKATSRADRFYIAGHSCLDEDVISNRWIEFPVTPKAGDLLVWSNTAGYQMDLLENEFHRHPMPKRLCIQESTTGKMSVTLDN